MKGKGPRQERETTITFNEVEGTASIWTASAVTYRRLRKMGYSPTQDRDRSANFEIPKKRVVLTRDTVRIRTAKQIEASKRNAERLRSTRFSSGDHAADRE